MTYPATPTFWLEQTELARIELRRYSSRKGSTWTCETGWHQASVTTGDAPAVYAEHDDRRFLAVLPETPHDDPRWPTECDKGCGYTFTEDDHWQDNQHQLYEYGPHYLVTITEADPGASWDAWWMPDNWRGPDGIALMVKCPNGSDWHVDGQASNCTRKGEKHECWVRHGDPRQANVTVDKNGDTCAAGAGSILAGDYHGFLQGGILTAG